MSTSSPTLAVGQIVTVMRLPTRETAQFHVHEIQEFRGSAVVYGATRRHGIVVQSGVRESPERDGVFVYVPNGDAGEIEAFCAAIGSGRLGIVFEPEPSLINVGQTALPLESRYYPIIHTPFPCWFGPQVQLVYVNGLPRPSPGQAERLMGLGRSAVGLWLAWQADSKQLPGWAILQRDLFRNRTN